ncbi:MAG: dockerin type I domain-containing protein, partial [Oscillospiraceae bacterium]
VQKQLETTLSYMARTTVSPQYFKEWEVMTLARGGYAVPEQYYQGYYDSVAAKATETKGIFDAKKYTENSRVILALSAIGKDAKNVGGYDLTKALADYPSVESQGANGVVYALLALDSNNYAIPTIDDAAKQATRDKYIDYILSKGLSDGGFAFFGSASDVDSTAMVLQSLAPYQSKTAVAAATDKGLDWLSKEQKANGAYQSYGSQSCESTSQVIMALTALGIDPKTDKRFIKADGDLFTAISEHYVEGGGFSRTAKGTKINQMSTVQATQGLVAYSRFASGKNSLFDMTDAGGTGSGGGTTDPPTSTTGVSISVPRKISGKQDSILYAVVQLNELPQGKFKLLDGVINIPDELAVEDVVIGSRFDGGKLQYKLDEVEDKLRFVYTNTELNDIIVNGTTFPVDLITIKLKVKTNLSRVDGYKLEISAGGISLKTTSKDAPFIFDTSHSTATSTVTKNGILAKELYAGDGIDVIPANKKAVALEFLNITEAPEITFGNIVLYHSAQLTQKNGTPTYVTLVDKTQAMEDITQFTITEKPSAEIIFGDTNTDKVVNAQDALNVVSAWLRKGEAPTDEKILSMNVNSDARINTVDAMAIMENYINNSELAVLVG